MIPKDVIICDWHYERPDQTPVYFAMKGLSVVTCPWRNAGKRCNSGTGYAQVQEQRYSGNERKIFGNGSDNMVRSRTVS